MTDDQLAELRFKKLGEDTLDFFLDKVEKMEDEEGLIDLLTAWFQAAGASMAVTKGATEDGWMEFSQYINASFAEAYVVNWKAFHEGE